MPHRHVLKCETEHKKRAKIKKIVFRDKTFGWRENHYSITFANGKVMREPSITNPFHRGYLQGLFNRPSCGVCKFANIPRIADITLADFWKYEGRLNHFNDNLGISLVVCSSEKGINWFDKSSNYLEIEETDKEKALDSCRHLANHPLECNKRKQFFNKLQTGGYYSAIKMYGMKVTLKEKIRSFYKNLKMERKTNEQDIC